MPKSLGSVLKLGRGRVLRSSTGLELEYMLSTAIWTPDEVSAYAEYNGSASTEINE